jgi:hypothetical protein
VLDMTPDGWAAPPAVIGAVFILTGLAHVIAPAGTEEPCVTRFRVAAGWGLVLIGLALLA